MKVSVLIPSYNLAPFIGEAIESVLNQSFTDFQLLIEDDGSTDESVNLIQSYQARDSRISLVAKTLNEGQNQTTNNLVRMAQGEYIALLAADDVWAPDKLQKQVDYLDSHPECGIVFSSPDFIGPTGEGVTPDHPEAYEPPAMPKESWQKRFLIGNCLFVSSSLYRRSLHDALGFFDESLHLLADLEWYMRIVQKQELKVIPEKLTKIRMRPGANLSWPSKASLEKQADEMALLRSKYNVVKLRPKKFMIATPFYEVKGYSPYIKSLVDCLVGLAKHTDVEFEFVHVSGDSYVWRARNSLAAKFLASDCSHLVFIDSDQDWEPEGFFRLLKAEAPIVGAAYRVKNNWEHFGIQIQTEGDDFKPKVREDGLIYASMVPTGFMKISRNVFERLQGAEPDNWYWEPDEYGTQSKRFNFFGHILEDHVIYGEDISFNKRWQRIGGELFVEPRATIGHYGTQCWKGNYDTFLRSQPGGDLALAA